MFLLTYTECHFKWGRSRSWERGKSQGEENSFTNFRNNYELL